VHILSDTDLLGLWESGSRRHPLDRALLALAAAFPGTAYDSLADWPIGRRNQALTKLRCRCFGPSLRGWTACAACGEKLEFELDGRVLAGGEGDWEGSRPEPVAVNGLTFRVPTSRDLARAVDEADPAAGAVRILEACVLGPARPASWSEADVSAIGEQLALADPLAEMNLALHCPGCGRDWQETLDVVSFFWTEVESRARRILAAVHTLASSYGWSESEILSLSESRRSVYLEMAQS
jgi:hypothetical protein